LLLAEKTKRDEAFAALKVWNEGENKVTALFCLKMHFVFTTTA